MMATTVRVSIDEQTIVFVVKMPESAPDPYTSEYFALTKLTPEKYTFHPQDAVPEQYQGGGSHVRRTYTPPKTPWMKRLQRTFEVPYDTFVYFVENNPLALVFRNIMKNNVPMRGPGIGPSIEPSPFLPEHPADHISESVYATPTQNITTSAKSPQNENQPSLPILTSTTESISETTSNIEIAKTSDAGTKTIVLVFRRVPTGIDVPEEEEGQSLPQIIETRTKGRIDTNAQGLTYPDLEQIFRLQQFLRHALFQRDVYCVNGRWIAIDHKGSRNGGRRTVPLGGEALNAVEASGSEPDSVVAPTVQDLDISMLGGTWVKKLADAHNKYINIS